MIRSGPVSEQCETADVALRGIFVVMDRPRPEKSLVSLTVKLPGGGLNLHGMVARVVKAAEAKKLGVPPGMGIQFYGLGKKAQTDWESFIAEELGLGSGEAAAGLDSPSTTIDVPPPEPYASDDPTDTAPPEGYSSDDPTVAAPPEGYSSDDPTAADREREIGESPSQVRRSLVIIDRDDEVVSARKAVGGPPKPPPARHPRFERAPDDTERSLTAPPAGDEDEDELDPEGPPTIAEASPLHPGAPKATEAAAEDLKPPPRRPVAPVPRDAAPPPRPSEPGVRAPAPPGAAPQPAPGRKSAPPARPEPKGPAAPHAAPRGRAPQPPRVAAPRRAAPGAAMPKLAPAGIKGHAVYRLAIPTVEALEGFAGTALPSGGVFVRTLDLRPAHTPAIVCVVHPLSADEFHLPGEVVPGASDRTGVAVAFARVTERTVVDFRNFIALGIPDEDVDAPGAEGAWEELTITDRAADRAGEPAGQQENTHEVDISDITPLEQK